MLPPLKKHLFINGGNIIMVQMENEYGSYGSDIEYKSHLRYIIENGNVLLAKFAYFSFLIKVGAVIINIMYI